MRGRVPALEQRFFEIFSAYYDLERSSARRYTDAEYSLERMQPIAAAAGNPENDLRLIHVAGTKGKGSTCYFLAAMLAAAGRRCGTFTSPHLATVRERFQVNNALLPYAVLLDTAREFEAGLRRRGLRPSLFEIMTVLALRLFVDRGCDFAVLETGIGGRLDATNYIPRADGCAITAVSLDHTRILGNTPAEIAAEKAGIIKPGTPVVIGRQPFPEARRVLVERARELEAPVCEPASPERTAPFLPPGAAPFLRENAGTALAVCDALGITPRPERFRFPEFRARCEVIRRSPLVLLDAAHNADSARRLRESIEELFPGQPFTVILGVVKGKDTAGIVREISGLPARFILTHPDTPKGSALEALETAMSRENLDYEIVPVLRRRDQLPAGENLLFTGSFFTALIGERLFQS